MGSDPLITSQGLHEWVIAHGCEAQTLSDHKANVIFYTNPKLQGKQAYIDLPLNEYPMKDYLVYRICMNLGIEIPTRCNYMNDFDQKLRKRHNF